MSDHPKRVPIPTISRIFDDGTIVELLFDATSRTTSFAVARPGQLPTVETSFDTDAGERLVPYSAQNNLIVNECVLLPSDIGDFGDKGDLVREVQGFLHRYVDLSPIFEEIAAHYILLTWVYDAFNDLGYLRFRGDYGTGKTRALLTLGSLSYKAFFASGASTVSPIFHIQDAFQGTFVFDEADFRFSDATAELTKILNNGSTRGLPVLRTMTNKNRELNPTAFRVFGPKIVAMREGFSDRALESRFLTEETGGRPLRGDVPIHLPASFKTEALVLRNKLLAWRLRARHTVGPDLSRLVQGVEPRINQTSLALLSVVDDDQLRRRIERELAGESARVLNERAASPEAAMLASILAAFDGAATASIKTVAENFNTKMAEELGHPMSHRWVGGFVRSRLHLSTIKQHGVYVVPAIERAKVNALALRFGLHGAEKVSE